MQLPKLMKEIETLGFKGDPDGDVRSICYDSRQCKEKGLFVAISGLKTDGHQFISDALSRGAGFIVHERDFTPPAGITAIRVSDSRKALGRLGRNFFGDPSASLCLVAIVGTNGKTTVSYLLESILRAAGLSVGVMGTVNYRYRDKIFPAPNTTPESFEMQKILREMADCGVTHCVAEVSSHAIDLHRVDDCAFDLGIFTNLSREHLDYHKTMGNYFHAKKRFFTEVLPAGGKNRSGGRAIINIDDPWGQRIFGEIGGNCMTFGLETPGSVTANPFRLSLAGIEATVLLDGEKCNIASSLLGRFNLYNILAAAAAAKAIAIPGEIIRKGIAGLASIPGRLEKLNTAGQPAVFVDYAHTEDALKRVLENLNVFRTDKIITVFGCGGDRDRGKRPLMGEAAATNSDLTIVTSDNPRTENPIEIIKEIEKGIHVPKFADPEDWIENPGNKGYVVIPDRKEAIAKAVGIAGIADIVLIAGKGHEDYQIIGSRKIPFDDRAIAREELNRWRVETKRS